MILFAIIITGIILAKSVNPVARFSADYSIITTAMLYRHGE